MRKRYQIVVRQHRTGHERVFQPSDTAEEETVSGGFLELTDEELQAFDMAHRSLWEVTAHLTNDGRTDAELKQAHQRSADILRKIVEDFNKDVAGKLEDEIPGRPLRKTSTKPS